MNRQQYVIYYTIDLTRLQATVYHAQVRERSGFTLQLVRHPRNMSLNTSSDALNEGRRAM